MSNSSYNRIDIGHLKRRPEKSARLKSRAQRIHADHNFLPASISLPRIVRKISYRAGFFGSLRFASMALILILVIQGAVYLSSARSAKSEILGDATSAYTQLSSAGKNLGSQDFSQAEILFAQAQDNIRKAQERLNNYQILQWLAPQAATAHHLLVGAGFMADAGQKLSAGLSIFNELKVNEGGLQGQDLGQKIQTNRNLLADSRSLILKASDEFNAAGSVPLDYAATFDQAKQQINQLSAILDSLIKIEDLYLSLFNGNKTYLLVFENYDEARATGGFIGTYGVLKTNDGSIQSLKIQSIYNLDGSLTDQIAAPGPMQPAIKQWGTRDANWFADFPTSATKLLQFFEDGDQTADGVLAMTPKIFEDLLKLTGPIDMPAYGVTLTSDNFQEIVQLKTSHDYDKVLNQPKKFLDDFAPVLLARLSLFNKDQWFAAFGVMQNNFASRQAVIYSTNPYTQKIITDAGFAGQILDTDHDYLMINNSNLGGTKSDLHMTQSARLNSKILGDGTVINTLQINRANNASLLNKDYLRVLVPQGSTFISATGFDNYDYYKSESAGLKTDPDLQAWDQGQIESNVLVHTESGKSEFSGWLVTNPGEIKTVTLTYILPFKIQVNSLDQIKPYSLLVQKQIGSLPYDFAATLDLGKLQAKWSAQEAQTSQSVIVVKSNTNSDDFWAWLLSK